MHLTLTPQVQVKIKTRLLRLYDLPLLPQPAEESMVEVGVDIEEEDAPTQLVEEVSKQINFILNFNKENLNKKWSENYFHFLKKRIRNLFLTNIA